MVKGESSWANIKVIIGWILNILDSIISLPARRLARILKILASISATQRCVSLKKWQQVLDGLSSMTLAIPATVVLFSILQEALKTSGGHRVRLTSRTQAFLQDFHWFVEDVGTLPTAIDELVPDKSPSTQGACNASKKGVGFVHFVPLPNDQLLPLLWYSAWPKSVASKLVSVNNPHGTITSSNLELAATIAQFDVLVQAFDVHLHRVHNLSDSAATVTWQKKGAASTPGPVTYLLRIHALHQRHHRYLPLHDFIPGMANVLSNQSSPHFHLTDSQLLAHFNSSFPHTIPWHMCPL
jgi:hypothetical protein